VLLKVPTAGTYFKGLQRWYLPSRVLQGEVLRTIIYMLEGRDPETPSWDAICKGVIEMGVPAVAHLLLLWQKDGQ
jgi:hypothetical protein